MTEIDWAKGQGWISAGRESLEWACWGPVPDTDPVIVMLHEGLGCVAMWRDFPEQLALATGCSVFAYSRAGYGQSDPTTLPRPLDYMTREAIDVLPDVLNNIGAGAFVLLGHSDGATISTEYAGRVADYRVRGLILIAPHFFAETIGLAAIRRVKHDFETTNLRDRLANYHINPDNAFQGWTNAWLDPHFQNWHVGEVIDYVRIPALIIQGEQDQYGTYAQVSEIEKRSYAPVDVVMIPDCKHAPHLERPEFTLKAISEFCVRLLRIDAAGPQD